MSNEQPFTILTLNDAPIRLTFHEKNKVHFSFDNVKINGIEYGGSVYCKKEYDKWRVSDHYMRRNGTLGTLTEKAWSLVYAFCVDTMNNGNFFAEFQKTEEVNRLNHLESLRDEIEKKRQEISEIEAAIRNMENCHDNCSQTNGV